MTLHPQAAAAVAMWAQEPPAVGLSAAQIRARRDSALAEASAEAREPVAQARDVDAGGVPCRWYLPDGEVAGALVFAHGGGFVFGEVETHDAHARRLANLLGLGVLSVDYRRPPEHAFPAAHDDVVTASDWLVEQAAALGVAGLPLVVLGDSAGGSLALVTALRRPGRFAAAVLVYPFIDPLCRGSSYATESDAGFGLDEARWFWTTYAGSAARRDELAADPGFCPLDAELAGLPPTQVLVAEHDILRDEDLLLAARARAAGVEVETVTYPGMIHGFWRHPAVFDAATESYADTRAFLDRVLAG